MNFFLLTEKRLCFTDFHARRFQIIARMTQSNLPRAFRDVVNKQPWRLWEGPLSLCISVRKHVHLTARNSDSLSKSLGLCSSLVVRKEACNYPLAESVWSSGSLAQQRRLDMFKRDTSQCKQNAQSTPAPIRGASGDFPVRKRF